MPGPLGLLYVPLDVRFGRDPKVRALAVRHGVEGYAAAALYLLMVCYCKENLTDGFVPAQEVGALAYPLPEETWRRLAGFLCEDDDDPDSEPLVEPVMRIASDPQAVRFRVCAYVRRNGTRKDAEQRAETNAKVARESWLTDGSRRRSRRVRSGSQANRKRTVSGSHAQTESLTESYSPSSPPNSDAPERPDAWADLGGGNTNQWTTEPGTRARTTGRSAADRHPSGRTVADAMRRPPDSPDGPPATDEQREKHAAEAHRLLAEQAAAAKAASPEPKPEPPEPFTGLPAPAGTRNPADTADVF